MTEYIKQWHLQYQKLVEFKKKNGNCIVPRRYQEDASLGSWINHQRRVHANEKLRLDRKGLLDDIGFVWRDANSTPSSWNQQYEKLVAFKQNNGHCIVPKRYQKDASLGKWVSTQRTTHSKTTIRPERKELLDAIGFVWRVPNSASWHQQYEKLVEFKRKNGHCLVPTRYQKDMALGAWVGRQRQFRVNSKLRQDQKGLLDEIGFVRKAGTVAARSSTTTNVRGLIIASFHALFRIFFLTLVLVLLLTCC
jgi:hypothetical protein